MGRVISSCMIVILLATLKVAAQDDYNTRARKYVDQYAPLAMMEQRKNGIPAAITLGQGILETEAGASELMVNANNHFGIKCKNGWLGETYTHTDDAPNECFKKYKCPADSYHDHSNLLRTNPRYAPLFNLKETDYAAWAKCLRKCGYATNPQYAQRLIQIIEDFNLQQYTYSALDSSLAPPNNYMLYAASYTTPLQDTPKQRVVMKDTPKHAVAEKKQEAPRIIITHDRHTVKEGETLASIAQAEGVDVKTIMTYNFLYPNEEPVVGSVLELQKPARQKPRVMEYAMAAHKANAIISDDKTQGADGDYVAINKNNAAQPAQSTAPRPEPPVTPAASLPVAASATAAQAALTPEAAATRVRTHQPTKASQQPMADDPRRDKQLASIKSDLDQLVYADDSKLITQTATQAAPTPRTEQTMTSRSAKYYTVKKGDTAFSIAKRNNITVAQLMRWNNMEGGTVKVGQNLLVKE